MKNLGTHIIRIIVIILLALYSYVFSKAQAQTAKNSQEKVIVIKKDGQTADTLVWHINGDHKGHIKTIDVLMDSIHGDLDEKLKHIELILSENEGKMAKIMVITDSMIMQLPDMDSILANINVKINMDSIQLLIDKKMIDFEITEDLMYLGGDSIKMDIIIKDTENGQIIINGEDETIRSIDTLGGHMVFISKNGKSSEIFTSSGSYIWSITDGEDPLENEELSEITIVRELNDGEEMETEVIVYTNMDGEEGHLIKLKEINDEDMNLLKESGIDFSENKNPQETFLLFPNPNDGEFQIKFHLDKKEKVNIRVFDGNGKEIFQKNLGKQKGWVKEKITLSDALNGTYFIRIDAGQLQSTKKIMIR